MAFVVVSKDRSEFQDAEALLEAAKAGEIQTVKSIFFQNRHVAESIIVKCSLILGVISSPQDFSKPADLLREITATEFDYDDFFIPISHEGRGNLEIIMLQMYAKSPTTQTAEASAMILAEYLRRGVSSLGDGFGLKYKALLEGKTDSNLTAISNQTNLKNSILAIQNALVDYVEACVADRTFPINRGGKALPMMAEIAAPEVSDFWSKKMTDIKVIKKYGVLFGATIRTQPVFE